MSFDAIGSGLVSIIRSKLAPPLQAITALERPRLRAFLEDPTVKLFRVVAPAGFGKTTLLAQHFRAMKAAGKQVAWLTVDSDDDEPTRFIGHLVAAFGAAGVELGGLLEAAKRGMLGVSAKSALWALLQALQDAPAVKLILDDVHRIRCQDVMDLLQAFIDGLPSHVSLIIAGRERPAIRTGALLAHGLLRELHLDQLRFTEAEAQDYFGSALNPQDVSRVVDQTEGWAVALQLARLWLRERGSLPLDEFGGTTTAFAQYLAEEILNLLPERIRFFLMATSILEQVNGDLSNAICESDDGWAILDSLEQQNVLIVSIDPNRQWYRYHRVFADFLRDRLHRLYGPLEADLHRRAADWFVQHGMIQEAVRHALSTSEPAYAAQLVDRLGGWRLGLSGGMSMLRALGTLDLEVMERFPRARLGQIYLIAQDGHITQARAAFEALRTATQDFHIELQSDWDRALYAESRAIDMILRIYEDEPISVVEMKELKRFVDDGLAGDIVVRGLVNNFLCYGYFDSGDYMNCRNIGYEAMQEVYLQHTPYAENYLRAYVGIACLRQGRLDEARSLFNAMRQQANKLFGEASNQAAIAKLLLAEVDIGVDDLASATRLIGGALEHVEQVDGWFDVYASGYLTAASLAERQQGPDAAIAVLERARVTSKRRRLTRLKAVADICTARVLVRDGRLDQADELLSRLDIAEYQLPSDVVSARQLLLVGPALTARAHLMIARFDPGGALAVLDPLRTTLEGAGLIGQLIDVLLVQCVAQLRCGDRHRASAVLLDMLDRSLQTGLVAPLLSERCLLREVLEAANLEHAIPERHRRLVGMLLGDGRPDVATSGERLPSAVGGIPSDSSLTRREHDVCRALADGLSNKEIAFRLGVSEGTIKIHRKNIYRKLKVHSRAGVVAYLRARSRTPELSRKGIEGG